MQKISKQQNKTVPRLRFPGFDEDWGEKRFGEVATFFSGGTPPTTKKEYYGGNIPFIKSGEIDAEKTEQFISELAIKNSSAKMVKRGDLLYALYGATSGSVSISKIDGAINQAVLCIRTKQDKIFLYNFLFFKKDRILATYLQGGQGNLSAEIIKRIKIHLPTLPEQQKIASFLEAVDERIEVLKKKCERLEKYKKGIMQKIFPAKGEKVPQIRFKDNNGKDFPDWEEKRLGEISEIDKGEQFNKRDLLKNGQYPSYSGGMEPSGYTDKWNTNKDTIIISEGGNSCGYVNFITKRFWAGGHCYALRIKKVDIDKIFLYQFLKYSENLIMRLRVGSGLPNIQKKDLSRFKINIPLLPEQQKIALFLSAIDKKIELVDTQIQKMQEWKRGLMQGLFV